MARGVPSPADALILGELLEQGVAVSAAQLERWRGAGILPSNDRRHLGRGRGSTSAPAAGAVSMAAALAERGGPGIALEQTVLRVFFERADLPLPDRPLREALAFYAGREADPAVRRAHKAQEAADPGSADDREDAASLAVERYFRSLDPALVQEFRRVVPRLEDYTLLKVLGVAALGEAGVEAIPVGSPDDDLALAQREGARRELAGDAAHPAPSRRGAAAEAVAGIQHATAPQIARCRDAIWDIAHFMRLVQFLLCVTPDHELTGQWADVLGSTFYLTAMCKIFPPEGLGEPVDWEIGTIFVLAQLLDSDQAERFKALQELVAQDAGALEAHLDDWLETRSR